jgi:hypothetical protein
MNFYQILPVPLTISNIAFHVKSPTPVGIAHAQVLSSPMEQSRAGELIVAQLATKSP